MPLPSLLVKTLLTVLDNAGIPLLYPEQFLVADHEYVLDITETRSALGWEPEQDDASMMIEAYKTFRTSEDREGEAALRYRT